MNEYNHEQPKSSKLVNGKKLLEELFDESSRPSKRWLDYRIAAKSIPFIKIGAKVFFDPVAVRAKFEQQSKSNK